MVWEAPPGDELAVVGARCGCCPMAQPGRGYPSTGAPEPPGCASFPARTASTHAPNRFGFLKPWVIYPLGERWCWVCWEKPRRGNSPCRIMRCFFLFLFFYCRLRFLDCSGEHFLAKTLKGKQEGKLSSDKLLYFWKYSHFLALNTFFFFSIISAACQTCT